MVFATQKDSGFLQSPITWLRPNLPGGFPPSTFSAKELNFCVRNGNRCILLAIVTTLFVPSKLNNLLLLKHLLGQVLDLLVSVSYIHCCTYTSDLSTR